MTVRSISILLVENDAADQVSFQQFVNNFSTRYRLDVASSAAEAVSHLKDRNYDVAFVDYRFKDGTAFDLIQKLGAIPTIFLTNPGQEEIAAMAMERGAYDYLIKDAKKNYLMLLPGTVDKVLVRRQAEEALRESEMRYKDLLDIVLDFYLCVSEQFAILLVNRAGARKLGYEVSELLGAPLTTLVHPGDAERVDKMLLRAFGKIDESHRIEFRLVGKDGGVVHVAAELKTQPQRGKQIPVARILARDITAVKEVVRKSMDGAPTSPAMASIPAPRPAPATVPAVPAAVPETVADWSGSEKLLVVDDAPEQREIAARMLAKLGYKVVTAEHGHAAIELMKQACPAGGGGQSPFDLVLLDMTMEKDFDGLDTYRRMIALFPGQRCIIVSGGGETERVKQARELGVARFVDKPYTLKIIGKAVRDELDPKG